MLKTTCIQKVLILLALIIFLVPQAGLANTEKNDDCDSPCIDVKNPGLKTFARRYGEVHVKRCGYVNFIEIIDGKVQKGTPAEIAAKVMLESAEFLKYDPKTMQKVSEHNGPSGTRIKYCQLYKGIPIYNTCLAVKIDHEQRVTSIRSRTRNNVTANTVPRIDSQQAVNTCQKELKIKSGISMVKDPALMVYKNGKQTHLVWQVLFTSNVPSGSWETLIDAEKGDLVMSRNLLSSY